MQGGGLPFLHTIMLSFQQTVKFFTIKHTITHTPPYFSCNYPICTMARNCWSNSNSDYQNNTVRDYSAVVPHHSSQSPMMRDQY